MAEDVLKVKYGLPGEVKYCKKCVMSNQKPNTSIEYKNTGSKRDFISFDDEGVCAACRYNVVKDRIDWGKREEQLEALLARYRKKDGSYDVIVPASGGKDSIYAAHVLKYKYKMNPLTVTWAPHLYRKEGWDNLQAMIHIGGFDNILFTPNGKVHRLLTRMAFKHLLHPFQPFVFGQKNIGPRFSTLYKVPLVMYGESNVEYGDPDATDEDVMSTKFFSLEKQLDETYLGGVSAKDLIKEYGLTLKDLEPYMPIDPRELKEAGTEVRYLGYYLKWDPQECYYYAVEHAGFKPSQERSEGTYSKYTEVDDKLVPLHFYTMHVKFGIGRAMYDAAQEIRNNKITREEGVALVKKFDGEYPSRWLKEILEYLDMSREEFDSIIDSFRSPHLWKKENNTWTLLHPME